MAGQITNKIIAVAGIAMIVLSMANFVTTTQTIASPRSIIYDGRFIAAMDNLSRLIPDNAVIVVSTDAPFVAYFTGHPVKVPFGTNSKETLINFMKARGYVFLAIFEGGSDVPALRPLFTSSGLKSLDNAFTQLAVYQTDFHTIHIFRLK